MPIYSDLWWILSNVPFCLFSNNFIFLLWFLLCVGQSPRTNWLRGVFSACNSVGEVLVVECVAVNCHKVVLHFRLSFLDLNNEHNWILS